ncbi:MAG: TolC family protein [Candidatus Sericytochromatia bacterium]|nr:TolC family protein [Candidatus Tanganyikabacteria bacterium]
MAEASLHPHPACDVAAARSGRTRLERVPRTLRHLPLAAGALTALLCASLWWAAPAVAGESDAIAGDPAWDERAAVAAFLAESPLVAAARVAADAGRAGLVGAGLWHNPELRASREQVFSAAGADENRLGVQLRVPVADKLALARKLAASSGAIAGARAEMQVLERIWEFRGALARVHFARARSETVAAAAAAHAGVQRIVEARVAAGEEAAYDLLRVRLARASLASRVAAHEAAAREAHATVEGMVGSAVESVARVAHPTAAVPEDGALAALLSEHPALRVMREEGLRAGAGRELAERGIWPDPAVEVGVLQAGGGLGYTAGIAWPVPVFDRAQGESAVAAAEAARWEAEERAAKRRLETELTGAIAALRGRQAAAGTYERSTRPLFLDLVRIAESLYREGEGGILGIIDAHEAALAARLELLSLQEDAHAARLRVEQVLGRPFALSDWRNP